MATVTVPRRRHPINRTRAVPLAALLVLLGSAIAAIAAARDGGDGGDRTPTTVSSGLSVASPVNGAIVPSPFVVEGSFSDPSAASVRLTLSADGVETPLATATVPTSGGSFEATLRFDTPSAYWGALGVEALDAEGAVVDTATVRVGF